MAGILSALKGEVCLASQSTGASTDEPAAPGRVCRPQKARGATGLVSRRCWDDGTATAEPPSNGMRHLALTRWSSQRRPGLPPPVREDSLDHRRFVHGRNDLQRAAAVGPCSRPSAKAKLQRRLTRRIRSSILRLEPRGSNPLAAAASVLAVLLNRRARHGPVGAEHAAIARFRLEYRVALPALIKPLAGIGGHGLGLVVAAFRTGQCRLKQQCVHRLFRASVDG